MSGRKPWMPADGAGQRPPADGGDVFALEGRAVWVDPELEIAAGLRRRGEPQRFGPGPETVGETLERLGLEDLER